QVSLVEASVRYQPFPQSQAAALALCFQCLPEVLVSYPALGQKQQTNGNPVPVQACRIRLGKLTAQQFFDASAGAAGTAVPAALNNRNPALAPQVEPAACA